MRTVPDLDSEYEANELADLNAEQWMLDLLALNPSYPHWGPHEDCMWKEGAGWESPILRDGWKDGRIELDDLNELVHFYFQVERDSVECSACAGVGYNTETARIANAFYIHDGVGKRWCNDITQDEADALVEEGRLRDLTRDGHKPTAAEVNAWNGHDEINRCILVEARAKRLGVYGYCETCGGRGHVFTEPAAHVNLVAWMLHPRKGASRGLEIKRITQADLPDVFRWLREAAARNAERFARIPDPDKAEK